MAVTVSPVAEICRAAREASRALAVLDTATKDAALHAIAARSRPARPRSSRPTPATWRPAARVGSRGAPGPPGARRGPDRGDRRRRARIAALPDPVGEVVDGSRLPNGLDVRKQRVPLGVVAVVYEARPNVTIDAAALCLKSGNAIVLRGSSSAAHSNAVLAAVAGEAAEGAGLPAGAVTLVAGGGREELAELATQEGVVDLIIPRGGEGLKAALKGVATVPVIYAASGNCHVFVDAGADLDQALRIVLNAKTQRPGVCNAAETLLVHADAAPAFLPRVLTRCTRRASSCASTAARGTLAAGALADVLVDATDADWDEEFLALVLAVKVVDSIDEAIEHVNAHGCGHSEAIVTRDVAAGARLRARRRRRVRVRQRVHPLHRRRRVRHGRGDRQLDPEAPRPRPDRPARAVHDEVRRARRRARAGVSRPPAVGILGGTFNPPHVGHLVVAQEARDQLGLDRVVLMPVVCRRTRTSAAGSRRARPLRAVPAGRRGGPRPRGVGPRAGPPGPVLHGRYPEGAA